MSTRSRNLSRGRDDEPERAAVSTAEERALSALSRIEAALRGDAEGAGAQLERAALERDCGLLREECDTLRRRTGRGTSEQRQRRLSAIVGQVEGRLDGAITQLDELAREGIEAVPWAMVDVTFNGRRAPGAVRRRRGAAAAPARRLISTAAPASFCSSTASCRTPRFCCLTSLTGRRRVVRRLRGDRGASRPQETQQVTERRTRREGRTRRSIGSRSGLEQLAAALEKSLNYNLTAAAGFQCPVVNVAPGLVRSNGGCPWRDRGHVTWLPPA